MVLLFPSQNPDPPAQTLEREPVREQVDVNGLVEVFEEKYHYSLSSPLKDLIQDKEK